MLVSIIIFVLYLLFAWKRYGISSSISASYYDLKGWGLVLFSVFCFGISIPSLIVWALSHDTMNWRFLFPFLGTLGILFVGASPMFRLNKQVLRVHMYGSYSGIGFWIIGLLIYGVHYPLFLFFVSAIFLFIAKKRGKLNINKKKTSFTWWIEIAAFISISLGILLK